MSDRLLVLQLETTGCAAEAVLNDIPVLRAAAGSGPATVQVNEYVLHGANELRVAFAPSGGAPNQPRLALAPAAARAQLVLARLGETASRGRPLAQAACAVEEGEFFPAVASRHVFELPVRFPRWRWLDAPVIDASAAYPAVTSFVQALATCLVRGDAETFLRASRVRLDEACVAYGWRAQEVAERVRSRIQLLHAQKALRPVLPVLGEMQVRPCAGGRLLECQVAGRPALRTQPTAQGVEHVWPMRVAVIDGTCHIFR